MNFISLTKEKVYVILSKSIMIKNFIFLFLATLLFPIAVFCEDYNFGLASWYGSGDPSEGLNYFTASLEPFDPTEKTCASWYYPFGTTLKVTNVLTDKSVFVRVNDRGPNKRFINRKIDLSRESFREIAPLEKGLVVISIKPSGQKEEIYYAIVRECGNVVKEVLTEAYKEAVKINKYK